MDEKNPHRVSTAYSERVHWKDGHACGVNDHPDRVELKPRYKNYPTLDFAWPRQRYELEKVEQLMEYAYARGENDRASAIASMMKTLINL